MLRLAAVALLVLTPAASAQKEAQEAADAKAVAAYRLTMPALKKYEAVADQLVAWLKTNPVPQAGEAVSSRDDMSIDEMASEIVKVKAVASALQKAGMTPREYVVFTLAMAEAGIGVAMKKMGHAPDAPAANVKFMEDNATLIAALQKKVESANEGLERYQKKG